VVSRLRSSFHKFRGSTPGSCPDFVVLVNMKVGEPSTRICALKGGSGKY